MEDPKLERLAVEAYAPPMEAVREKRSRGVRGRVALAAATAVALVATGFGVSQITGSDGAASPEAAVEALLQAIGEEDAMGVMELLAPNERDVLVPSVQAMARELTRVEILDGGLDLGGVEGLDLEVSGYELRTQGIHPDVASVSVTGGTLRTTADFRRLPLGTALSAALEEAGGRDLDETVEDSTEMEDFRLATVRSGGGWHVSLLYSLAEMDRVDNDRPVPDFGNGIAARGAATPEGAVEAMAAAFNDDDFTRMIELTAPDSMAVLHDYGQGWLDEYSEEDADEEVTSHLEVVLGAPSGSGDERTVPVSSFRWEQSLEDTSSWSISYNGSCIDSEYDYEGHEDEEGESSGDPGDDAPDDCPSESGWLGGGIGFGPLGGTFMGDGTLGVTVVQRDGAWYVDPARSVMDTMVNGLTGLSTEQARLTVDYWAMLLNEDEEFAYWALAGPELYEECPGVEPPAEDATFAERKEAGEACQEEAGYGAYDDEESDEGYDGDNGDQTYDEFGGEVEDGETFEGLAPGPDEPSAVPLPMPSDACYDDEDRTVVEACLQELFDSGQIQEQELRRYKCDAVYTDLYSGGEELTDEQYRATDEAFEACMADDVGTGTGATPKSEPVMPHREPSATMPAPTTDPATEVPPPTSAG